MSGGAASTTAGNANAARSTAAYVTNVGSMAYESQPSLQQSAVSSDLEPYNSWLSASGPRAACANVPHAGASTSAAAAASAAQSTAIQIANVGNRSPHFAAHASATAGVSRRSYPTALVDVKDAHGSF